MTRENELLKKIAKGETEYWEELIGMYYEDILRYCIYHAPDKTAAEDAVQETFLKVIRYMPDYRHRGKFRAFLYKVAANTCKDQWRKCTKEEWFDTDTEASDGEKKLPEEMIYLETGYAKTEGDINFLRLIRKLPEDQRLCVLMYYYEELSVSDIADALGCSTGTVKSRLNYARKKIRNDVEELERKGTKLYSVAPLPFILWMLREGEQTISVPGSFGKELVRQGAGIVKSGSAPTSGNTGSGKSGIRKTDPVKNGQAAGRKIVKSAAGKAAGKIIGTKAVAGAVGAAVIGGGAVAGYHIHQAKEQKVTKEEWQAAYKDWVGKWSDDTRFELFDMNGGDVREIVRVGSCMADGATVATCTPDGIREEEIYRIGMWYIPGGNVLDNNDGNMGVFYDRVFEIKDGEWLQIGDGECRMEDNTNPEYDENGDYVFRYKWDGKEVTKKKYEKKLKKLFGNRKPEALGNEAVSYHEIINQISHY